MNYKNVMFLYISTQMTKTVIQSQVINWLKLLETDYSINFTILFQVPIWKYLQKSQRKIYSDLSSEFGVKVFLVPCIKLKWDLMIDHIILGAYLFYFLFKSNDLKSIVQTRSEKVYKTIKFLKRYFNLSFVFELRGVGPEEYLNNLGFKDPDNINDDLVRKKYLRQRQDLSKMLELADRIVCVSNKMKSYVQALLNEKYLESKIYIIPGAADKSVFYWNPENRIMIRKKNNLSDEDILIIYSGRLLQRWHMAEFLFKLIQELMKSMHNLKFICLTPDLDLAMSLMAKYNIASSRVVMRYSEHKEINGWLNVSDYGIILREDIHTNYFSSPTKIPEYLMAGLPIILSKNIGDYSEFVTKYNLGLVVENDILSIQEKLYTNPKFDRSLISETATKYFAKEVLISEYLLLYESLIES